MDPLAAQVVYFFRSRLPYISNGIAIDASPIDTMLPFAFHFNDRGWSTLTRHEPSSMPYGMLLLAPASFRS